MVSKDTTIVKQKLGEVLQMSSVKDHIKLDEDDIKLMDKNSKEIILVEVESEFGIKGLIEELQSSFKEIHIKGQVNMLVRIETSNMTMSDLFEINKAIENFPFEVDYVKRALSSNELLKEGQNKMSLFLFVKD